MTDNQISKEELKRETITLCVSIISDIVTIRGHAMLLKRWMEGDVLLSVPKEIQESIELIIYKSKDIESYTRATSEDIQRE